LSVDLATFLIATLATLHASCSPRPEPAEPRDPSIPQGVSTTGVHTPGRPGSIDPLTGMQRCGPGGTGRIFPLGRASAHGARVEGEKQHSINPGHVVFSVGVQDCWPPGSPIAYDTGCDVRVQGQDLYVTSRFCLGSRRTARGRLVTPSCSTPHGQCVAPSLEPGTYTIHVENKSMRLALPATVPTNALPTLRVLGPYEPPRW
jgi:hypothetical protein